MRRTLLIGIFRFFIVCRIFHFVFQHFQPFIPVFFFFEVFILLINFSILYFNGLQTNFFLMTIVCFFSKKTYNADNRHCNAKNSKYSCCFFVICFHFEISSIFCYIFALVFIVMHLFYRIQYSFMKAEILD